MSQPAPWQLKDENSFNVNMLISPENYLDAPEGSTNNIQFMNGHLQTKDSQLSNKTLKNTLNIDSGVLLKNNGSHLLSFPKKPLASVTPYESNQTQVFGDEEQAKPIQLSASSKIFVPKAKAIYPKLPLISSIV